MRQETAFFDKTRTGELINRLSADTILVGKAVTDNVSDGLRAVAQSVAGVSMMVSIKIYFLLTEGIYFLLTERSVRAVLGDYHYSKTHK